MHSFIETIIFQYVKISGALWLLGVIFGGLATGQAEISYKFYTYSIIISFVMLIVARIEGHKAESHMSNIENLTGYTQGDWESLLNTHFQANSKIKELFETIVLRLKQTK